jgi:hypothetical protein
MKEVLTVMAIAVSFALIAGAERTEENRWKEAVQNSDLEGMIWEVDNKEKIQSLSDSSINDPVRLPEYSRSRQRRRTPVVDGIRPEELHRDSILHDHR